MSTAYDITDKVRRGERSAREVMSECIGRYETTAQTLRAFISFDGDRALKQAEEIDRARAAGEPVGLLAGVPIAVKDNICTRFGATTCGSKILEPYQAVYNAFIVDRLEQAGAIVVGKTNLDEFAMGSSTENSAFHMSLNPWNQECVPGGSSGGSAVAVASRVVPGAIGSDTGGSVRQPASFCGVVGLKPSYGRVSRFGLAAYGSSLDQIGPMATDVRDAALLLEAIAGHDPRDSTSVDRAVPNYVAALDKPLRGLRIGVCDAHFGEGLDSEVSQAVRSAIDELRKQGAEVTAVSLPHMEYAIACYYVIATAEASSNLARYDGVHYGFRVDKPSDVFDLYASSRGQGLGPEVKRRIMLGAYTLSSGYYDAYYLKALKVRTLIRRDFEEAFEGMDLLVSPVTPTPAFRIGEKADDPLSMYLEDIYTIAANLAGLCAISLPCGFSSTGLPIGFQLTGPAFGEESLLAAAHQYQLHTQHHLAKPEFAE